MGRDEKSLKNTGLCYLYLFAGIGQKMIYF